MLPNAVCSENMKAEALVLSLITDENKMWHLRRLFVRLNPKAICRCVDGELRGALRVKSEGQFQ